MNGKKVRWKHSKKDVSYFQVNEFYDVLRFLTDGRIDYSRHKLDTMLFEMKENPKDWEVYD